MKTITERIEALLKDAIKSQDNSIDNINDIGSEEIDVFNDHNSFVEVKLYHGYVGRAEAYLTVLDILRDQEDVEPLKNKIKELQEELEEIENYMNDYSYHVKIEDARLDRESHKFASRIGYKKNRKK